MPIKRMKTDAEIPQTSSGWVVNSLEEYIEAVAEIDRGLKAGEKLEIILAPSSRSKLKRPVVSLVSALRRYIERKGVNYIIAQRSVRGEALPRIYIIAPEEKRRSK